MEWWQRSSHYAAFVCAVILGILLLGSGSGWAVAIDYQGSRPSEPVRGEYGQAVPIYIVNPGARIQSGPGNGGLIKNGSYLEQFWLLREVSKDQKRFYLVGSLDENQEKVTDVAGWIDEDAVIVGLSALRTPNGIHRKALVINRWIISGQGKQLDRATVYQGPSNQSKVIGNQGLFQFFFTWKIVGDYWLLGGRHDIESISRPEESIIGWIKSDRLLEWNTRQAVQFNKSNLSSRKEPVSIYTSKHELLSWASGRNVNEPPIATEVLEVKEWKGHWMRFPLLNSESVMVPSLNNLMEVAYIGDQVAVDGGANLGSARAASSDYQKIEKMKAMVRNIDILLVIDATGSMFEIFPYVEKAIGRVLQSLEDKYGKDSIDSPDIRFSIVFYRDYHNPRTTVKHIQLTADSRDAMAFLRNEPVRPGEGANPEDRYEYTEAVFFGICHGLEETNFREGSFRQVIVIGDRGNHPINRDKLGYSERNVVNSLIKADASLLALHVADSDEIEADEQTKLFKDQFYRVRKMLMEERVDHLDIRYLNNPQYARVTDIISGGADKAAQDSDRIKDSLKSLQRGENMALVEQQHGVAISSRIRKMMNEVGLSPEDFKKSKAQICEIGWVASTNPKSGHEQLQTMLLVRKDELVQLASILSRLSQVQRRGSNIRHAWKSVLGEELGENLDFSQDVDELAGKALGLPVRMKLLKHNIDEIAKMNPPEMDKLVREMKKDRDNLMELISAGEKVWFSREGYEYAWVHREMLP